MAQRHIISLLLQNEAGAFSRVVGLFSARGYNIVSITAAPTLKPNVHRITIVTEGDWHILEQIKKYLNRLMEVVKVVNITAGDFVERGLLLVKIHAVDARERAEVYRTCEIFRGHIVDISDRTYTVEITGEQSKLDAFLAAIGEKQIIEMVATGTTGLSRGETSL